MSVNFYTTKGWMVGVDTHKFQSALPPDPAPVPIPIFPYAVFAPLSWGFCDPKSIVQRVTANGAPMIQKGHKKKLVPHVFLPLALPHPFQAVENAAIILKGSTACEMAVSSVTGMGEELATCLAGFWGLNENCDEPVPWATGHVFQSNTVKTAPSLADYVNAALGLAGSVFLSLLPKPIKKIRKVLKVVDAVVKYLYKHYKAAPDSPTPKLWSDAEKWATKKREAFVRKLLGGHS